MFRKLSRREFLKLAGVAASAASLGACTSQVPIATLPLPSPTLEPSGTPTRQSATASPIPSPTPTQVIQPILPDMLLIEAGSFQMGSADGLPDEQPVHTVNITRSFYIARYEVTFEEYDLFCQDVQGTGVKKPQDDGHGRGKRPVSATWLDVVAYCNWLSEKEGRAPCYSGKGKVVKCDFAADGYRLPSEAEWEYAARGGPESKGYVYAGSDDPDEVAWYGANSDNYAHPVGQKRPNELGLYDMSGNEWEWCWDWYAEDYYASSPADDPQGPAFGPAVSLRVKRGGRFELDPTNLRTTFRSAEGISFPATGNGFRLVRTQ